MSDTDVSRAMSYLLRHGAIEAGLSMAADGYVSIDDLLSYRTIKMFGVDRIRLERVVRENNKQRFQISADGKSIRASQGHTLEHVDSSQLLQKVTDPSLQLIHGTTRQFHRLIQQSKGLNRMRRNHVHFVLAPHNKTLMTPATLKNIPGIRSTAQVFYFVSVARLLEEGLEVYKSANGVYLCAGDQTGVVPHSCVVAII